MKKYTSTLICIFIFSIYVWFRFTSLNHTQEKPFSVTTWDALGYYIYLPSIIIYDDYKNLKWFEGIDKQYQVSGGKVYQANIHKPSGNYVYKYLGGVAILELPFFLVAHWLAPKLGYVADGFSPPYQYAIAIGALVYFFLALLLLRKILRLYFSENVTVLTLLTMMLGSNLIQYIAVDGAMSHAYIFPLYVLILYFAIRWHEKPTFVFALFIGYVIGLAMISRPTEAIMLFIPLLWNTQNKIAATEKWAKVKANKSHLLAVVLGGFVGILPQLLYWKSATGHWVYDVGSKWFFLNPFFRVLFGWEVGWFIYTPIAIFFVVGFFFLKDYPFRKSVITFCLLNIYIIIAWSDWRYGATYSCRALTQSYPVFALSLAAFIAYVVQTRWKLLFYILGIYLIGVNLFQIKQYDKKILHYRDMNKAYYQAIYLNPNPSALDMSLLDNKDFLKNEENYIKQHLVSVDTSRAIAINNDTNFDLISQTIEQGKNIDYLKITAFIHCNNEPNQDVYLNSEVKNQNSGKWNKVRIANPIFKPNSDNEYTFYVELPKDLRNNASLKLYISTGTAFNAAVKKIQIDAFTKK